jgi:HD-GYP domain-containing protein (c-di-GMP phosphodiesterase class II)
MSETRLYGTELEPAARVANEDGRTPEEREFLEHNGEDLVIRMFAASKTLRLYSANNRAAQRALADLMQTLRRVLEREGRVVLRLSNEFLLLNEHRIAADPQHYAPFEFWTEEMKKREVEAIEITSSADEQSAAAFLTLFFSVEAGEDAPSEIEKRLTAANVTSFGVARHVERETRLTEVKRHVTDVRDESNRVYFRTVALMGNVLRTAEEKQVLQVRKAKRLTQQMVDLIKMDESVLVGLASIKSFDAYTFAHSVNVCIYSMLIGDRMRLEKADVARLGLAALLHDIGKTYIPATILNSNGKLSEREWELMKYHTFFGVKELSRVNALRDSCDAMFVAAQHHAQFNGNGYPQRPGGWKLRLFSRIVTVADYYDAMTAYRTYQKEPITPDQALQFIVANAGNIFDPFIPKVFVQAMGLYPVGTIVELDGGEFGVVSRQNGDHRLLHRPTVEVLYNNAGAMNRELIDLAERDPQGRYPRRIVRALHESQVDVDKRLCFLADAAAIDAHR